MYVGWSFLRLPKSFDVCEWGNLLLSGAVKNLDFPKLSLLQVSLLQVPKNTSLFSYNISPVKWYLYIFNCRENHTTVLLKKCVPLRKVSWSGMKKAPEHIAAKMRSLINQNLEKKKKYKKET